ncbi:sigma-70 family RNA polymerase sigma factor [candidate division WOR-3 bacterium]|nr:sigma-70 family RNA polymerase sigma factor [candidate division WOR-3 bacterium]
MAEYPLPVRDEQADLVAELKAEKPGAFEKLFHTFWRPVMALALIHLSDTAEAEDCAIETFEDLARGIKRFRGESKLSTYVYQVALNRIRKHHRSRKRSLATVPIETCPEHQFATPPLEARFETADEIKHLYQDLKRLPRTQREAITLRHILGLKLPEVARTLGIPENAAAMRINRGIKKLQKMRQQRLRREKYGR